VQRCKELKEICEGQIQFARKGSENMMPELGGSRGQEFVNILDEIKITFRKNLDKLRGSD
jgi:dynein heavy chain